MGLQRKRRVFGYRRNSYRVTTNNLLFISHFSSSCRHRIESTDVRPVMDDIIDGVIDGIHSCNKHDVVDESCREMITFETLLLDSY